MILVSNRLPVSVQRSKQRLEVIPSAGGRATGLGRFHDAHDNLWVGWPGAAAPPGAAGAAWGAELDRRLAELRLVPVHIGAAEARRFYEGSSNGVLWPLLPRSIRSRVTTRGGTFWIEKPAVSALAGLSLEPLGPVQDRTGGPS